MSKLFSSLPLFLFLKTHSQSPAFGRKSEVRSSKSDNSSSVAGCLLPRVGRGMSLMEAADNQIVNNKL